MKLRKHPRSNDFTKWFVGQVANAKLLAGEYYRVAGPRHTTADEIISGIGAFKSGGRWNVPARMKVVYLSDQPETAMYEANEHYRYYRLPISQGMPRVTVAVMVKLESVLDLTDMNVAATLPDPMKTLLAEDWRAVMNGGDEATTQTIGSAAFNVGLQALLVPSKPHPAGRNLLVFPENLTVDCRLEVHNAAALAKLGKNI